MQSGNNTRYQVSLNSSPFGLGQNYDTFLTDLAKTEFVNLVVNPTLSVFEPGSYRVYYSQYPTGGSNNTLGNLVGWTASTTGDPTQYPDVRYYNYNYESETITFFQYPSNYIQQDISSRLEPNTNYSIEFVFKTPVSGAGCYFNIQVIPTSANQIFNLEDYSQSPSISAMYQTSDYINYTKGLIQFVTGPSITGPVYLRIQHPGAPHSSVAHQWKYIGIHKGLIEIDKLPPKDQLKLTTLSRGTAGTPSLSFYSDTDTGLFSPGINQVALTVSGTPRLTVSPTAINFVTPGLSGITNNGNIVLDTANFNNWGSQSASANYASFSNMSNFSASSNYLNGFNSNQFLYRSEYDSLNYENGFVRLPNNILMQWGKTSTELLNQSWRSQSFPLAFNNIFNLQATLSYPNVVNGSVGTIVRNLNTFSFEWCGDNSANDGIPSGCCYWYAIGTFSNIVKLQSLTYVTPGVSSTFNVPTSAKYLKCIIMGGGGGGASWHDGDRGQHMSPGGPGGLIIANIKVNPGDLVNIYVGRGGGPGYYVRDAIGYGAAGESSYFKLNNLKILESNAGGNSGGGTVGTPGSGSMNNINNNILNYNLYRGSEGSIFHTADGQYPAADHYQMWSMLNYLGSSYYYYAGIPALSAPNDIVSAAGATLASKLGRSEIQGYVLVEIYG